MLARLALAPQRASLQLWLSPGSAAGRLSEARLAAATSAGRSCADPSQGLQFEWVPSYNGEPLGVDRALLAAACWPRLSLFRVWLLV